MTQPRFLLDSNICIYILDNALHRARERVERELPGAVVVSAISYAEVMVKIAPAEARKVEALFRAVPIVAFDGLAARIYSRLPFRRARFDRLIAAHALSLDLTLVTNNQADFADIPGLRTENWTRA